VQDPIGDFVNALAADVMSFAADKTYEAVLSRTASMCELSTFPILTSRAKAIGYLIDKVELPGPPVRYQPFPSSPPAQNRLSKQHRR